MTLLRNYWRHCGWRRNRFSLPRIHEDCDLIRGEKEREEAARERIESVALPETDPVYGSSGPLHEHWHGSA